MSTSLQSRLKRAGRWLPMLLLPFAAQAQFNYSASNATTVAGTYTDLGTGGTAIATANPDDANSAAQPIGFTFNFNGTAFTQFILNTNGLIKLGTVAPATAALYYEDFAGGAGVDPLSSAAAAETNLIMPFNFDLEQGISGTADFRVQTTGTAPDRICTIQWKNLKDKAEPGTGAPAQYSNFSFQAKLYESGSIEFVYNTAIASANAAATRFPNVGLKGSSTAANQVALALKGVTAAPWSTTTFINQNYGTSSHNINKLSVPDAGRTYRFLPGAPCADPTAATIASSNNSITLSFTPGAGNISYNVTYTTGGAVQTLSPAPTGSPIVISGLLPGTQYNVTLQSVCAGNTPGTVLRGSATTSGTPPAAPYATLPYTEGFEGPWVNGLATRDLPTANWRNTPATSDNSWRREDDGFASANWRYPADETGATPPYVTRFSAGAHSARFHSFGAGPIPAGGTIQGRLDLYVNLSGTGSKTLSFDYINPSGADKVDVLLSTDGGATFSTAPLLTVTTSSVFANKAVTITSSSATSVIRFQATSDYGNDDIGLDNLRLSVVTATRNEALAAAVSVAPNPAHQRFTLSVPAGSLRTASATLANTLGQVVATRQLNLPAAGGSTDFDVSRLAAGIYTLTLQSGNDLVVKRVAVE